MSSADFGGIRSGGGEKNRKIILLSLFQISN
jgi:hypothetical protein